MGRFAKTRFVAKRQGNKCFYCEGEMWISATEKRAVAVKRLGIDERTLAHRTATKEHLIRQANGGKRTVHNIVAACGFCNSSRGDAEVEDHKAAMRAMVAAGTHPTVTPGQSVTP